METNRVNHVHLACLQESRWQFVELLPGPAQVERLDVELLRKYDVFQDEVVEGRRRQRCSKV